MADVTSNEQNPAGGNNTSGSPAGQGSGAGGNVNNPNLGTAPSVVELTEDSMVRLPGAKDPVRYGDHYRGFQSEFTKRAQEVSRLRQEHQKLQQQLQDYQRRMQAGERPQQQAPNPSAELAQQLKSLTYLKGEDAAKVVEHITAQLGARDAALKQRDLALGLLYKKLQQVGQTVQQLNRVHNNSSFESKISKFVKDAGLPEKATNWAQELYVAYEGDDLDQEFPRILKERWEQLTGLHEEARKAKIEQARRLPFVPGKGGNGSASRPLENLAKASAKDIADAMWPGMVDGEVET